MRLRAGMLKRIGVLVCVLMLTAGTALASFDALVFPGSMKVYATPTRSVGSLPLGTRVTVEAVSGEWARIRWNGYVGFAKCEDMMATNPVKARTNRATTIEYITPDNLDPRRATLPAGVDVYVRGFRDGKVLVSNADFTVLGYISSRSIG